MGTHLVIEMLKQTKSGNAETCGKPDLTNPVGKKQLGALEVARANMDNKTLPDPSQWGAIASYCHPPLCFLVWHRDAWCPYYGTRPGPKAIGTCSSAFGDLAEFCTICASQYCQRIQRLGIPVHPRLKKLAVLHKAIWVLLVFSIYASTGPRHPRCSTQRVATLIETLSQ